MNPNYFHASNSRGGGKLADTWHKVRDNNILRGIFTIIMIALVIAIVYGLYTLTQKKVKEELELKCRAAPKGCVLHSQASPLHTAVVFGHPQGGPLPPSKNANDYSMNIWLYTPSANWAGTSGNTWRHVLSGLTDFSHSQPSVWLHPHINSLMIRWNTIPRNLPHETCKYDPKAGCTSMVNAGSIKTNPTDGTEQICSPICNNSSKPDFNWTTYKPDPSFNPESGPSACNLPHGSKECCPSNATDSTNTTCSNPGKALTIIAQQCVPNIPLDRWYLLSISTRSNSADVYVDGKLVNSVVFGTSIGESPQKIKVGGTTQATGASGGSWSQLRYYDTAISPFDVLKVYSWGPYPFDLSKAEVDWKAKYERITGSVSASVSYTNPQDTDTSYLGY